MATSVLMGLGERLRQQQPAVAEELVRRQFAADPSLDQRYGPIGRRRCLQDANYHLAYLADAMDAEAPALFANYVAWAKVMLSGRGIPADDLARYLDSARSVVSERLEGDERAMAVEYLSRGLAELPTLASELPSFFADEAPHVELGRTYLDALLRGERHLASQKILDACSSGIPVQEVYQYVFEPAQHELGRLWQMNQITVAQEHYCTAATQLIMSQLYPRIFGSERTRGTLVATCVAGDLHEIGIRMVADFFEMAGWNTFYLGANMPAQGVVDTVVQRRAHVLAISATISQHLRAVADLIQRVRAHAECERVRIMVGGYPFLVAPELWQTMGADACAVNAQQATSLANRWIADDAA